GPSDLVSNKTILMARVGAPESASARARAHVGSVIAERYRIDEVLAEGEMGAVYRAEHVPMRMRVALKLLYPEAGTDAVARFEREAIVGAHIRHDGVAAATDSGVIADGSHYLVVEHVPGTTLREVIAKGPLPVVRAVRIAHQLALALGAAHE